MPDPNIIKLKKKTLIRLIENSVGTKLFNSLFVQEKDSGKIKDVLNNGEFSCAAYVTGLLYLAGLIDALHATVKTTREKLPESGWKEISPEEREGGDIIFWERKTYEDGSGNEHVGFSFAKDTAISTDYIKKQVTTHHDTFGFNDDGTPKRKIISVWRYNKES